jgi:colicin import membrane protein
LSTVSKSPGPQARPAARERGPFRYGFREVLKKGPGGTEFIDHIPLTLEDVLHPQEGDFIVQTDAHDSDRAYLKAVSKSQLLNDRTSLVLSDCQIDWNIPGVKPLCPDIAVFFNVKRRDGWDSLDVAAEGAIPALVVEVTSRSTRKLDLGTKVDYYFRAKVPVYVIADAVGRGPRRRVKLIAYRYHRQGYKPIAPDDNGRIYLAPVRLWLGTTHDRLDGFVRLACYDPDSGEELGDAVATRQELVETRARVEAEVQARARAEARAEDEARARAEAEDRIRALEAQLKQSRGRKS